MSETLCVRVFKKSSQYSQSSMFPALTQENTSEIHIITQDKQNSNSSSLKIASYLTQNQAEKVKLKKKGTAQQQKNNHPLQKNGNINSFQYFHRLFIVVGVRAYSKVFLGFELFFMRWKWQPG